LLEKNSTVDGGEVGKYFSDKLSDPQQRLQVMQCNVSHDIIIFVEQI